MMGYSWPRKNPSNKFGAVKSSMGGSQLECSVRQLYELRQKAGEIRDLKFQQSVHLTCGISWRVDFSFYDIKAHRRMWGEAKGLEDRRYQICKKLWAGGFGPGWLEIWKGHWRAPRLVELVKPNKSRR